MRGILLILSILWSAVIAPSTAKAAPPPRSGDAQPREIAPDVWLLRGAFVPGHQPDGNSVMLRGEAGWVVVDSGRHAAHAQRILDFVAARDGRIQALVNTHWHLDHVSGNLRLRAAHPHLVVHASDAIDAALQGFLARSRDQLVRLRAESTDATQQAGFDAEIARIDSGPALRPDRVVSRSGTQQLAGRKMRINLETRAATAGDVWLFDPATRVLIAGDLVTLPAPFLDTACPARWRAALARIDQEEFEQLVPGHGAPMRRDAFRTYRKAFDALLDCAATDVEAAICVDGWMRDAGPLLGDAPVDFTRSLAGYYVQQRLRGKNATADCGATPD